MSEKEIEDVNNQFPEINKLRKQNSFRRVRLLLKDELIENLNLSQLLIGIDIDRSELEESIQRMRVRNENKTHENKLLGK